MSKHHWNRNIVHLALLGVLVWSLVLTSQATVTGLVTFEEPDKQRPQDWIKPIEDTIVQDPSESEFDNPQTFDSSSPSTPVQTVFGSSSSSSSSSSNPSPTIESIAPFVARISPRLGAVDADGNLSLTCYSSDNDKVATMSLYIQGVVNQTVAINKKSSAYEFNLTGLAQGVYNWSCVSKDVNGNVKQSEDWSLIVNATAAPLIDQLYFSNQSTEWSRQSDLRFVCGATLDRTQHGTISWLECLNAVDTSFDGNILIEPNNISVLFNESHSFNSPANLTFRDLPWQYPPQVYRNGELCNATYCSNIQYFNGTLTMTVQGFSSFTTGSNSRLEIWDETDPDFTFANKTKYPGEQLTFFANYTNIPGGTPISDATCIINFSGQDANMVYNANNELYEFSHSLDNSGTFEFNVSCEHATAEDLQTFDTVIISSVSTGSTVVGASVDAGLSERGSDSASVPVVSEAGNMTGLLVNATSITTRWQGFYGNVSGEIILGDGQGNRFYDWDVTQVSGEIFASNDSFVIWNQIYCVNFSANTNEELYSADELNTFIGYTSDSQRALPDAINATFNLTFGDDGDTFSVGSSTFTNSDNCSMVALHTSSGYQTSLFQEVLMTDNNSVVFAALIDNDASGFNGVSADFEMIVGVNGTQRFTTRRYFFFTELG